MIVLCRTASVLLPKKVYRFSSAVWTLSTVIENNVRFKHSTTGSNNPRSGRRESGKTHHGKFETAANIDMGKEDDTETDNISLLEDKYVQHTLL